MTKETLDRIKFTKSALKRMEKLAVMRNDIVRPDDLWDRLDDALAELSRLPNPENPSEPLIGGSNAWAARARNIRHKLSPHC